MANGKVDITVRQLTGAITRIGNAFDGLAVHVKPAADQTSRISGSFQAFNKSLKEIQKYGEELTKTLNSIAPKGGKGKINFDNTVFSAFSRLVDAISDSIDTTKLEKLKTVSVSMKTFTNSLKDMVSINNGQFDAINGFVSQMNKPITKGKKDSPLSNIMSLLEIYTKTLGDLGTRTQEISTGDDGKEHIKNIINPRIQGIQDIFNTIKSFTARMTELNGAPIEEAITSLDNAEGHIHSFILKLGNFMRGEKDVPTENGGTRTVEVLNDHVQGARDVIKTIDNLVAVLNDMGQQSIHKGIDEVESANTSLCNFIEDLGKLGQRTRTGGVKRDSKGRFTSVSEVKEHLSDKVQGARDVVKTIELLSGDLAKMAEVGKTGLDNVDRASTSLQEFINKLSEVGARDTQKKGLVGNIKSFFGGSDVETVLNVKVQSVRDIISTLGSLSTNLTKLATDDVKKGTTAVDLANTAIYQFIDHLGSLGERGSRKLTLKPTKEENVFQLNLERELNPKVQGVQDVLRIIGNLSGKLEQMGGETIPKGIDNIDKASTNLQYFMIRLGDFGRTKETKPAEEGKEPETVEHLNTKVQSVRDVIKSVDLLSSALGDLSEGKIKTGLERLGSSEKSLKHFIDKLGGFTRTQVERVDSEGKKKPVEVLDEHIQSVRDIIRSIDLLSSALSDMTGPRIKAGIKFLGAAKESLNVFMEELGVYTRDTKKVKVSGGLFGGTKTVEVLDSNVQSVRDIIKSIDSLSTALSNLGEEKVKTGLEKLDAAKEKLSEFMTKLGSVGKDSKVSSGGVADKSKELEVNINAVRDVLSVIKMLSDNLGKVSGINVGVIPSFSAGVEKAIPVLTEFINKMASLAKLSSFPDFERVANAIGKFNGRLEDADKLIHRSTMSMIKLKAIMRQIYTATVGGAVIYSIVRGIKSAIKAVFDLEYAMARVNTIARVDKATLKDMTATVQDMSASFGIESSKVSKALYDINSATIKGAASLKILRQSAALAVAGFTDIEKVSDLISKAVNAYEYNVSEASKISDILFVTVERGINPMEELSSYFGRLFTVSANAGVSLEEVGAGLATLTARGYQTNVASTALNSAILKLSTGTKELNKLFLSYGYASSASALRTLGLAGALKILNKETGGATDKLHDLGFNYRDIRAATTLASSAINEYNKTLNLMNDESYKNGLTQEALAKVQDTVTFTVNRLKQTYVVFIQTIADYLDKSESIKNFLKTLTKIMENLMKSMKGQNLSKSEFFSVWTTLLVPRLVLTYAKLSLIFKILPMLQKGFLATATAATAFGTAVSNPFRNLSASIARSHDVASRLDAFRNVSPDLINAGYSINGHPILGTVSRYEQMKNNGTLKRMMQGQRGIGVHSPTAAFAAATLIIQGGAAIYGAIKEINDAGGVSWKEYWKDFNPIAAIAGGFTSILDILTGTPLSEGLGMKVYEAIAGKSSVSVPIQEEELSDDDIKKAGYQDMMRDMTREFAFELSRKLNMSEFYFDESGLIAKFDDAISTLQDFSSNNGVDEEFTKKQIKVITDIKDRVMSSNDILKQITPNMAALMDVFEDSSKKVVDSFEKYAGPLQKNATEIYSVERAIGRLSKFFGWSPVVVESSFSSGANFDEFTNMYKTSVNTFVNKIEKLDDMFNIRKKYHVGTSYIEDILFEAQNHPERYQDLYKILQGYGVPVKNTGGILKGDYDKMRKYVQEEIITPYFEHTGARSKAVSGWTNTEAYLSLEKELEKLPYIRGGVLLTKKPDQEKYSSPYAYLADTLNVLRVNGLLNAKQEDYLSTHSEELHTIVDRYSKQIMSDPSFLPRLIADYLVAPPEIRRDIEALSSSYVKALSSSDEFRKSVVQMGLDLNTISVKLRKGNVVSGLNDVVDNVFGLLNVENIKRRFLTTVYSPESLQKALPSGFINLSEEAPMEDVAHVYEDYFEKISSIPEALNWYTRTFMEGVSNNVPFEQIISYISNYAKTYDPLLQEADIEDIENNFMMFFDGLKNIIEATKTFINEFPEADYYKFYSKVKYGTEPSAFKQYFNVDRKELEILMEQEIAYGEKFRDVLIQFNKIAKDSNYETALVELSQYFGPQGAYKFLQILKNIKQIDSGSSSAVRTEFKNIKKRITTFITNYEDAFLTPLQKFRKTEDLLKKQVELIKKKAKTGELSPELVNKALDNAEKLQKLGEEVMTLKVPSSITASEAVKTGSKEAFDMVSGTVFKDMYKVNVDQLHNNKKLLEVVTQIRDASNASVAMMPVPL